MKKALLLMISALSIGSAAASSPVAVKWIMGENQPEPRQYSSQFVVTNVSDNTLNGDWGLYFNLFPTEVTNLDGSKATVDEIVPNYYVLRPTANYVPLAPGDSMVVEIIMPGTYQARSFAPDGGHFAFNNQLDNPQPVEIVVPELENPSQWYFPGRKLYNYPDGDYVYKKNEQVNPAGAKYKGNVFDIFPTPKSMTTYAGTLPLTAAVTINAPAGTEVAASYLREKLAASGIKESNSKDNVKINLSLLDKAAANGKDKEYYELQVGSFGLVAIVGATPEGVFNGVKTLVAAIEAQGAVAEKELPCVKIADYPDLRYRGVMLDIARNFYSCENMKEMIDLVASYKINYLQFHFCDDEAWRVEIPGLPELTEVGSRKGLTLDEKEFLIQTYRGNGDPNDKSTTANGYYTRSEFIDMLKYAASRGVTVVPEVETPGHARAAIVSMKNRYAKYIDTDPAEAVRYKLWDDDDASVYRSAQGFHDNILCIGQEGVYNFIEKVVDEIDLMYKEAGLKLEMLHIGGDEVPEGAWEKSPVIHEFMKKNGYTTVNEVREYFIDRVTSYLASKDIKVSGWQEVALNHNKEYDAKISPRFGGVNAWSTVGSSDIVPYTLANAGYPVILSNVNNFYFDLVYSRHQDELGLHWGGATDEFASWQAQPYDIYRTRYVNLAGRPIDLHKAPEGKVALVHPENIIGVQGQLFAETIRSYEMVQYMVFPKVFGLAERGWNATPEWAGEFDDLSKWQAARVQYNLKVGLRELPIMAKKGVNFHVAQPGIIVENGMLIANAIYPGVTIRYTLDGSNPTANSPQWTAPVAVGDAKVVKARAYYLGKESVATLLFLNE